jgi:ATP-dependent DNA ligase
VLDGELVAMGPDGKPNFNLLQNCSSQTISCCHFCETFKGTDYAAKNQDHLVQIAIKLLPKSCAQNACGIVRHSTLWLRPEAVAQIAFLEWTEIRCASR